MPSNKSYAFWEMHKRLATIYPDSETGAVNTGWKGFAGFNTMNVIVLVGDIATSGVLNATIEQAQDSSGTGAKAITGITFTQQTQAGGDGNDDVILVIRAEDLDVNNGFDFVRITITPSVAAAEFAVLVLGSDPRFLPISGFDTDWQQIADTFKQ